jgi:hypothetical protein
MLINNPWLTSTASLVNNVLSHSAIPTVIKQLIRLQIDDNRRPYPTTCPSPSRERPFTNALSIILELPQPEF